MEVDTLNTFKWTPKFNFAMEPLQMDRLDMLASQMKDLQEEIDEIKEFKQQMDALVYLQLTTQNEFLKWKKTFENSDEECLKLLEDNSSVHLLVTGVFEISLSLLHTNWEEPQVFRVFKKRHGARPIRWRWTCERRMSADSSATVLRPFFCVI